jgi:hypothetical protein
MPKVAPYSISLTLAEICRFSRIVFGRVIEGGFESCWGLATPTSIRSLSRRLTLTMTN